VPDHTSSLFPPRNQSIGVSPSSHLEWGSWLCVIPVLATGSYYLLPHEWQGLPLAQFLPQLLAYLAFGIWLIRNDAPVTRLGLSPPLRSEGLRWGLRIGLALGIVNITIILWIVPWLGQDILFLKETPHAQIPSFIMIPWFITLIAILVEMNFRGFLLGRLLAWFRQILPPTSNLAPQALAIGLSALAFSFDPFMVVTFRHLHWIAVWDGLVWGILWVRLRNLHATIVAHAVEVMVMYTIIKLALG
jgi:hypothetical protein